MNTASEFLQKEFRIAQVIWIAILAALVIYLGVGHAFFGREFVDAGSIPVSLIRNILAGVGGLMLVGSWLIRRKMLEGSRSGQPRGEEAAVKAFKAATMISAGICETVGLFGLVLVFLGDSLQTLYLFVVVAAAAMIIHRPKIEELEKLAGKTL